MVDFRYEHLNGKHRADNGAQRERGHGIKWYLYRLSRNVLPLGEVLNLPAVRVNKLFLVLVFRPGNLALLYTSNVPANAQFYFLQLPPFEKHAAPDAGEDGVKHGILG